MHIDQNESYVRFGAALPRARHPLFAAECAAFCRFFADKLHNLRFRNPPRFCSSDFVPLQKQADSRCPALGAIRKKPHERKIFLDIRREITYATKNESKRRPQRYEPGQRARSQEETQPRDSYFEISPSSFSLHCRFPVPFDFNTGFRNRCFFMPWFLENTQRICRRSEPEC